jgi:hypothetical protein
MLTKSRLWPDSELSSAAVLIIGIGSVTLLAYGGF